jgi:hypothetical protein
MCAGRHQGQDHTGQVIAGSNLYQGRRKPAIANPAAEVKQLSSIARRIGKDRSASLVAVITI